MDAPAIEQRVRALIAKQVQRPEGDVLLLTRLSEIGVDSAWDRAELACDLEEEFAIRIPTAEDNYWTTVESVIASVVQALGKTKAA